MNRRTYNLQSPDYEEFYEYNGTLKSQIFHSICGITYPCPEYDVSRKSHNIYSIGYVYEGEGVVQENNKIYTLSPGDFYMLHPNVYQHFYSNPKNPWKKISMTISHDTNFFGTLLKLYNIEKITLIKGFNDPSHLEKLFEIYKSDKKDISSDIEKVIFSMVVDISNYIKKHPTSNSPLATAKDYIHRGTYSHITVQSVADHVGLEVNYFSRLFKKEYGITPSEYIIKIKMEAAKRLLATTTTSIEHISMRLSFSSIPHFSNTFRKICGTTPLKYRHENTENVSIE